MHSSVLQGFSDSIRYFPHLAVKTARVSLDKREKSQEAEEEVEQPGEVHHQRESERLEKLASAPSHAGHCCGSSHGAQATVLTQAFSIKHIYYEAESEVIECYVALRLISVSQYSCRLEKCLSLFGPRS